MPYGVMGFRQCWFRLWSVACRNQAITWANVNVSSMKPLGLPVWVCFSSKYLAIRTDTIVLFNTLRPRQDGCHFPDDIFKCIFLYENVWILIWISLMFVPNGPINNIPALVQIMAWRRPGDKPLSEPMVVRLSTHICVTRPQWVNNNASANPALGSVYG